MVPGGPTGPSARRLREELGREVFDLEVSIAAMACPPRYARKAGSWNDVLKC